MPEPVNVFEYQRLAGEGLAAPAWDYYRSGANDEVTLRRNREAYDEIPLHYRVLVDVGRREMATTYLGHPASMPILVAPTAFHALATPEGERATARAAAGARTIVVLSTLSNTDIEDVVEAAGEGTVWFQLYVYKDRGVTEALVRRAEAAGAQAIVLTVDAPFLGRRERDVRNRFRLPDGLSVKNLGPAGMEKVVAERGSGLAEYFAELIDASVTWKDLEWLAGITRLPVLVKGVVRADDAVRSVEHGAQGIVVSNHGGRQLDTSPATIEALPAVADAVAGRALVLVDGGVRRGTDVLKALALGAKGVLVGRPILWGLAVDGEAGARRVLELLREEVDLAMALAGCPDLGSISRDLVDGCV